MRQVARSAAHAFFCVCQLEVYEGMDVSNLSRSGTMMLGDASNLRLETKANQQVEPEPTVWSDTAQRTSRSCSLFSVVDLPARYGSHKKISRRDWKGRYSPLSL